MPDQTTNETTYLAYIQDFASRDVQYAKTYMPEAIDDDNWLDFQDARIIIGIFNAPDKKSAINVAAEFAGTDPRNVDVFTLQPERS